MKALAALTPLMFALMTVSQILAPRHQVSSAAWTLAWLLLAVLAVAFPVVALARERLAHAYRTAPPRRY